MPPTGTVNGFDRIKLLEKRLGRDLTQQELADAIGYARSAISNLERGIAKPSPALAVLIAGALGCNRSDLTVDGSDFSYTGPSARVRNQLAQVPA
jgi:transcriptional regulator with XRE-family HTH domain